MPNHVRNILTFPDFANLDLFTVTDGKKEFDFNKLLPMPEDLNVTSGSITDIACLVYLYVIRLKQINGYVFDMSSNDKSILFTKESESAFQFALQTYNRLSYTFHDYDSFKETLIKYPDTIQDLCDSGKHYLINYKKYGSLDWYGWCNENWGTKWNAYECEVINDSTYSFWTAWATPERIFKALHERFPDVEFSVIFADEDIASNCGRLSIMDGELYIQYYDNDSQEAFETYIEVWGMSDCIGKDEDGNYYHMSCESCAGCD